MREGNIIIWPTSGQWFKTFQFMKFPSPYLKWRCPASSVSLTESNLLFIVSSLFNSFFKKITNENDGSKKISNEIKRIKKKINSKNGSFKKINWFDLSGNELTQKDQLVWSLGARPYLKRSIGLIFWCALSVTMCSILASQDLPQEPCTATYPPTGTQISLSQLNHAGISQAASSQEEFD